MFTKTNIMRKEETQVMKEKIFNSMWCSESETIVLLAPSVLFHLINDKSLIVL